MPYLAQTSLLVDADQLPIQQVVERIAALVMDAASQPARDTRPPDCFEAGAATMGKKRHA
jgi:hypothetical protein